MVSIAATILREEEDWRARPYLCSERYPTVGYGFRIGPQGADIELYDFELPQAAGEVWLQVLIDQRAAKLPSLPAGCGEVRHAVLVCMSFQLGHAGLMAFKNMWAAIAREDYTTAAREMLASRWARQTPGRAKRMAELMQRGTL